MIISACPEGQVRYEDYCYKALDNPAQSFDDNANQCLDMEGHLWFPASSKEISFVKEMFPVANDGDVYYLGISSINPILGMNFTDGTYSPGIPFYTRKFKP